jgi:hypothetical protein
VRASAFVYPWDVLGDPDAPERLAALGVRQVTLASAYHSTRAVTPRHPEHRVVTAEHAAVYYPADPSRWAGRALRPYAQRWLAEEDPYGEAAAQLAAAGLAVHSWVVLAHNSRLGAEHPGSVVRNAYGDPYPWAPCVARPEVREYLVELAAEAAVRPGAAGTELESCGWYGFAHLHAHDKTGGVPLDGAAQYLMSLCFCDVCAPAYGDAGVATAVRKALEPVWRGEAVPHAGEWAGIVALLGEDLAELTLDHRRRVARDLQRSAVAAVRAAAGPSFRVLLHADPAPHRTGANTGVDAPWLLDASGGGADGLVLPCAGGLGALRDAPRGAFTAANFTIVSGMGGSPSTLAADARAARALGAAELRLYHAGLASDADLAETARQLAELR